MAPAAAQGVLNSGLSARKVAAAVASMAPSALKMSATALARSIALFWLAAAADQRSLRFQMSAITASAGVPERAGAWGEATSFMASSANRRRPCVESDGHARDAPRFEW